MLLSLRLFASLVPVAILLLSFLAIYHYPITRSKHAEIRLELEKRRMQAR